ncbi:MAG: DUF1501 domain-containing protein [Bryobacterales bacterium]|nr:DUF1501 domain-containing protein [Bryobacteraceae bacterium]MDW8353487.1 DUF1501 domain-containing protein [Bryobacterales bacterium]
MNESRCTCTRRHAIRSLVGGSMLLPGILTELLAAAEADPLAPKPPHFPARAKRVIFLFMTGGASHVDTFDPKPKLFADHGKKYKNGRYLIRPRFTFKPYGKSGIEVSELFPHVGECVDDICVIRSMRNDHGDHFEATLGIHTGSVTFTRPSMGSWISYGLGTENRNLPSFVVIAPHLPYAGGQVWSSDFLPACHQGVRIVPGPEPIPHMTPRTPSAELQEMELGLIEFFNRRHLAGREHDAALAARIKSFEVAFGMQKEAPEAFDLSQESDATLEMYGLERGSTQGFAWQCLVARRLAERGVRFIELIDTGASNNWDAHGDIATHIPLARNVDRPIAALLKDLKQRGMLDETLVVWTTEFGRTPFHEKPDAKGREHHARAYSSWLAGGGVKGGMVYGETDEYGIEIAANEMHIHDFHATILHLLGLDHTRLTYRHAGRDFRLTDVAGRVIREILA